MVTSRSEDTASIPPANRRVLEIGTSSTKVAGGKATLTVGSLRRTNDIFSGEFQIKVAPYFFKNDKGNLQITVTDEMIQKAAGGSEVKIIGTAKSLDKNSPVNQIKAIASPADAGHGALKLWVKTEERTLFFETKYRFAE